MVEFRPDELDNFFRQGTNEPENLTFREDAWNNMNLLLDRQQRRHRIIFWLIILGFLFSILFILSLAGIFPESHSPGDPESASSSSPMAQQKTDPVIPEDYEDSNIDPPPERKNEIIEKQKSLTDVTKTLKSKPEPEGIAKLTTKEIPDNEPELRQTHPLPGIASDVDDDPGKQIKIMAESEHRKDLDPSVAILKRNFQVVAPEEILEKKIYQISQKSKPDRARFAFGIHFSPELTSTGIGDFNKVNFKLGALVSYSFSKRFNALLGLMFTNKKYLAGPGEYSPSYGFFPGHVEPIKTDGKCDILEIPFEITYDIRSSQRGNIYIGLGISNYLMLNEVYNYEYDQPTSGLRTYWHKFENELYWFSFGQIQLGYHAKLSRNYSLSFGPYFQIPFQGIGNGHVNLYSFGTQVRFNRFFHSK